MEDQSNKNAAANKPKLKGKKKKVSLSDFKVKSVASEVKVSQMQFLKTAGG